MSPNPMPLISRGVPTYTNNDYGGAYPASNATNGTYHDAWISSALPAWLAVDLSSVPEAQRGRVYVSWYNDPFTGNYDPGTIGQNYTRTPRDYTVEANGAAGGGAAPTTGWVVLATVTGNTLHSRSHVLDLTGYNWLRINVSAVNGSAFPTEVALNLDIHDASAGTEDSWLFLGDSITMDGFLHDERAVDGGTAVWSDMIAASLPEYHPVYEDGGITGYTTGDALAQYQGWLDNTPARYVSLLYGTNDANAQLAPATYYQNMLTMVDAVIAAGKVPVVAKIPWAHNATVQANAPDLNAQIDALYADRPAIVRGPDLWSYFQANQTLINDVNSAADPTGIHPTGAGYVAYRQQWVTSMLQAVYDTIRPTVAIDTPSGTYRESVMVTLTANEDAAIYYTLDGSAPTTASTVYAGPFTLPVGVSGTSTMLRYMAVDRVGNQSDVYTEVYAWDTVPPVVTATPPGGSYLGAQSVTLSSNEAATIYYTLDGSTPTTASPRYTAPVTVPLFGTLKWFGVDTAGNVGEVQSATYSMDTSGAYMEMTLPSKDALGYVWTVGDRLPGLRAALKQPDGTAVDLTDATVSLRISRPGGALTKRMAVVDAPGGVVHLALDEGDMGYAGSWPGEITVTFADGRTETWPTPPVRVRRAIGD